MDMHLSGKVAVVTGASKGIGLAVSRALVREGARVVAAARGITRDLSQFATGGQVHPVSADLSTRVRLTLWTKRSWPSAESTSW